MIALITRGRFGSSHLWSIVDPHLLFTLSALIVSAMPALMYQAALLCTSALADDECCLIMKPCNKDLQYDGFRKEQALSGEDGFHDTLPLGTAARGREELTGLDPAPRKISQLLLHVLVVPPGKESHDHMIISLYDHHEKANDRNSFQ